MSNLPEQYTVSFRRTEPYCQEAIDKINEMFHTQVFLDLAVGCHVYPDGISFYGVRDVFNREVPKYTAKEFYQLTNS